MVTDWRCPPRTETLRIGPANAFEATRLPDSIFSSIDHFDNFLTAASIITLTQAASVSRRLNSTQYDALVTLTESYFAAGYEWFTLVALRAADQEDLAQRFAG